MRPDEVKALLTAVESGERTVDEAVRLLQRVPIDDIGFARLDTHRELRQGLPEAIFSAGKRPEQIVAIAHRMLELTSGPVLATKADGHAIEALTEAFPAARVYEGAGLVAVRSNSEAPSSGAVAVVSGGTSDLPISEEAAGTLEAFGLQPHRIQDVGVAGLHRLLGSQQELHEADVVIVVAGMEGALASLVGGIAPGPVVAVPTSVGYGSSFEGLAALLAMLNSCAAGVAVMNIDNGFGAAMFTLRTLMKVSK